LALAQQAVAFFECHQETREIVKTRKQDEQSERVLLQRACSGSREAFDELARMHSPQVYQVSLNILRNHADAEDNLQNVFCKVFTNIHRFEGRSRFSTWLVRITINEALMTIRGRRSLHFILEADLPMRGEGSAVVDVEDDCPSQERQYIAKELAAKALCGVHPSLADLFIRQSACGWTQRELARETGTKLSAFKSRIFAARMRMKDQLQAATKQRAKGQQRGRAFVGLRTWTQTETPPVKYRETSN
jgi:RNA polymerase sigma-70 factor, ECF subfamily